MFFENDDEEKRISMNFMARFFRSLPAKDAGKLGLSRPEFFITIVIKICMDKSEIDKIKVSEIVKSSNMPNAAVSRALKSLDSRGITLRETDLDDRRSVYVSFTEKGKKIVGEITDKTELFTQRCIERMGREKFIQLSKLMNEFNNISQEEFDKIMDEK